MRNFRKWKIDPDKHAEIKRAQKEVGRQGWEIATEIRDLLMKRSEEAVQLGHIPNVESNPVVIERMAAHYALMFLTQYSWEQLPPLQQMMFEVGSEEMRLGAAERGQADVKEEGTEGLFYMPGTDTKQ